MADRETYYSTEEYPKPDKQGACDGHFKTMGESWTEKLRKQWLSENGRPDTARDEAGYLNN